MKTAIYIRVSTEEQAKEGFSISAQKRKLKAFCVAQEWELAGLYADEGISAKDMNRPDLQRMIKDIEDGKIDCVLVWRLDRLTRSVFDLYKLLEIFDQHDCKFKSATEIYDTTTAMGRMFITIVAALAQWERENMGERISMGYDEKVRQGKYAHNKAPMGYDLDLKTGELTVNQKEAKTVRLIYDLYTKEVYGFNAICKYLNENEIRTKKGNMWNDKPLGQLIKNPLYYGAIRWKDMIIEDAHEPIITKEQWEKAQRIIVNHRNTEPRRVNSSYIFSGKLRCNKCGHVMGGGSTSYKLSNGEKVRYNIYRCIKGNTGECQGGKYLSEVKLEKEFLRYIESQDFNSVIDQTAAAAEKKLNATKEPETIDRDQLEKELDKIEKRKRKWQYAWSDDLITEADFIKRMEEAKKEEEEIKSLMESNDQPIEKAERIKREEIINALKNITKNWYTLDNKQKKQLVDSTIKRIHYSVEKIGQRNFPTIDSIDFV